MPRNDLEALALGALVLLPLAFSLAHHRLDASRCDPPVELPTLDLSEGTAPWVEPVEMIEPVEPVERVEPTVEPVERVEPTAPVDEGDVADDELMAMRTAAGTSMFLVYAGELVLASYPDELLGTGKVRSRYKNGRFYARQTVVGEALPEVMQGFAGREFVVHEIGGGTCVARVDAFALAVEEEGDSLWELGEGPSRAQLREHAKEAIRTPTALVAALTGPRPCGNGIAVPFEADASQTFVRHEPRASAAKKLRQRVRQRLGWEPEYAELRRDYREYREGDPDAAAAGIETFDRYVEHNLEVHPWRQVSGSRQRVVVQLVDRDAKCGYGFYGSGAWIFEDGEDGLQHRAQGAAHDIKVLIDGDHDGSLQWMTFDDTYGESAALGGSESGEDDIDVSIHFPNHECPC